MHETQETWLGSLGRSPGVGNGNPLQCSCLENPTDGGAWRATVPMCLEELNTTEWAPMWAKTKTKKRWGQSCGPRMQEHRACPQDGWCSRPLVGGKDGWDHCEAAREQIRQCLVNLEIRLDSASQWFSHYLLVLQINALGRLHKHFIPISSLGIFFC